MNQTKRPYVVYRREHLDYGDGHIEDKETIAGTTWAVSPKKAVNNIMYRLGLTTDDLYCEWSGDGYRQTSFRAVPD